MLLRTRLKQQSTLMTKIIFLVSNRKYAYIKRIQRGSVFCDIINSSREKCSYEIPCDSKLLEIEYIDNSINPMQDGPF